MSTQPTKPTKPTELTEPIESPTPPRTSTAAPRIVAAVVALMLGVALVVLGMPRASQASTSEPARHESETSPGNELSATKAVVLGLVEGLTEYLPISSTGHLLVAENLMGIGKTDATKEAADTYTIAIQFGAILAVAVLYMGRLRDMALGLVGKNPEGRRTLIALAISLVPAVAVGVIGEKFIKEHLLGIWPVIVAWAVGAAVIFATAHRFRGDSPGTAIGQITARQAVLIGLAQCVALWPGTSRSLATILGALLVGLSLRAAVEFSFLLGLVTLTGATFYDLARHGSTLVDTYGLANPLIGAVVAFISAIVAVRWMVSYLQRHDLKIFAWYRLGAAALAAILVTTGALTV